MDSRTALWRRRLGTEVAAAAVGLQSEPKFKMSDWAILISGFCHARFSLRTSNLPKSNHLDGIAQGQSEKVETSVYLKAG